MIKLSERQQARTRQYIELYGRNLDSRLYEFHFQNGDRERVLEALSAYQNTDGGFGHALEPDMRTPASSVITTSLGLLLLKEIGATFAEPIVQAAIEYLFSNYDRVNDVWPIVPPQVEDAPHAPWWNYNDSAQNFSDFLANPRACIIGHLYQYKELVPADFLEQATRSLLEYLEQNSPTSLSMHDLLCFLNLAEADNLPSQDREQILAKLAAAVREMVNLSPESWSSYGLQPLDVAPRPDSPLRAALEERAIEANLDYQIKRQLADGSWPLTWSWADVDPVSWSAAEREWKANLALNNLKVFRAYGRLAES